MANGKSYFEHLKSLVMAQKEGECMICPVCGKYEAKHNFDCCPYCCFEFDPVQIEDYDCYTGANTMTVNQYRKWWNYKMSINENFVFTDEEPTVQCRAVEFFDVCPVCGKKFNKKQFYIDNPECGGNYDGAICSKCGWIRDLVQAIEPDMKNGLNKLSVNEYKKWCLSKKGGKK